MYGVFEQRFLTKKGLTLSLPPCGWRRAICLAHLRGAEAVWKPEVCRLFLVRLTIANAGSLFRKGVNTSKGVWQADELHPWYSGMLLAFYEAGYFVEIRHINGRMLEGYWLVLSREQVERGTVTYDATRLKQRWSQYLEICYELRRAAASFL